MNEQRLEYIVNNVLQRLEKLTVHINQLNDGIVAMKWEIEKLGSRDKITKETEFNRRHLSQLVKRFLDEDFEL